MNVLKIGVLTFHRCINYGSYWQARCLVEGLQAMGHNAEILDHDSRRINLAEWKCAYKPVLPMHVPESDYPLYRKKIESFFSAFDKLPLSKRFSLEQTDEMDNYDMVVVGSDEVWNLFHPWYGKNSFFYGDGIKTNRLVSYAASFGNYPASWLLEQTWADKLQNFDAISVRDANSQTIIQTAVGIDAPIVLDPCLQFTVNVEERSLDHLPEKYLAVYGHNFSNFFISEIKQYATKRKLPLISIGYKNFWADEQWITADPHDFANFIANAKAVATNFFHGCVFALRNSKPFVCETTPYRSIKVQDLMNELNGEKHLVNEETRAHTYTTQLTEPLNDAIFKKMNQLRQTSYEYLDEALTNKQLQIA
jgi:hypothetical protein